MQIGCNFSPKFKAKAPHGKVVWSPPAHHLLQQPIEHNNATKDRYGSLPELPSHPVWTPKTSPLSVKKEYKPIYYKCHSSPVSRKEYICNGLETEHGMPIALRSEVEKPLQHEWYKRLFRTIHKPQENVGKQHVTSGYLSGPETPLGNTKTKSCNLQKTLSTSSFKELDVMKADENINNSFCASKKEKSGQIEEYITDFQTDKEEIPEGNFSRIYLYDFAPNSAINVTSHKKSDMRNYELSALEQKRAYKQVQEGGEPPLFGFRKTQPEKLKGYKYNSLPSNFPDINTNFSREHDKGVDSNFPMRNSSYQGHHKHDMYEEERQRKFLQEVEDLNSRRHTDFFTSSQKSPIPLNRYDNFVADLAPKSPRSFYVSGAARALYDFNGENSRELNFKKGDIIYIKRVIDENWLEGEHKGKTGMLPVNYLEHVNRKTMSTNQTHAALIGGQARAKYLFQAESNNELSFNKGDIITLLRQIDNNWFEGKIDNRKGIFPISYVEVLKPIMNDIRITDIMQNNLTPIDLYNNTYNKTFSGNQKQTTGHFWQNCYNNVIPEFLHIDTNFEPFLYRALYKYIPQNMDELELEEGDIVHVFKKCDDGWFVGTSQKTGCFGTFPGNYVTRI